MVYLSIDIAKTNHVVSLINETSDIIIHSIKLINYKKGFSKLLDTLY